MAYTRDTFTVYDEQFQTGLWERMAQNTQAFNAASANALVLRSDVVVGEYVKSAFIDAISEDAISRRDPNNLEAAGKTDITQSENISVNLYRRIGPIDKTLDAWQQIARDPGTMSLLVGNMIGDLKAKKLVNTGITAAKAAITRQSGLVLDVTGKTNKTLSLEYLNKGMAKMGDAFARIACWVTHSKSYFDLVGQQITDKMDTVAGAIVYGGTPATLGRPVVVTDSPALVDDNGSSDDDFWVLGLTQGGVTVVDSAQSRLESDTVTGLQNLVGRIQGEFAISLGVRGFAWDTTAGGANPMDAALATTTNWNKVATSLKDCAGIAIKCR
jgi:hypothetical protein